MPEPPKKYEQIHVMTEQRADGWWVVVEFPGNSPNHNYPPLERGPLLDERRANLELKEVVEFVRSTFGDKVKHIRIRGERKGKGKGKDAS